jgi:hypothetical protein
VKGPSLPLQVISFEISDIDFMLIMTLRSGVDLDEHSRRREGAVERIQA